MNSEQTTLGLTPADRWQKRFEDLRAANPGRRPGELLEARFSNASKGTVRPDAGPFDFERLKGFGQFLAALEGPARSAVNEPVSSPPDSRDACRAPA
jgi:hypothetical protein